MSSWEQFDMALDAAARRGETIRVWWRDDDAGRDDPALSRLLDLAERHGSPLALAVVPSWLEPATQGRIAASSRTTVLQHGFAHANHARTGGKSIELGGRDVETILDELRRGFEVLRDAFGATFLEVLVPPWNRIDSALLPRLPDGSYRGLSVYGRRQGLEAAPGVTLVNTHVDLVNWRGDRGFVGETPMLEQLIDLLESDEPIGILTHHLVMDEAGWTFLERLLAVLIRHPATKLCPAPYLFELVNRGGQA